jgi:hypothetical protein
MTVPKESEVGGSAGTGAAPPDVTDAQVQSVCQRLQPTWDIPNGAMKWALGAIGIETNPLPDGTRCGGAPPPEPSEKAIEAALNSFAFRKTEGLGGKPWLPHDIIDALKAAYAIDRGGAAQPPPSAPSLGLGNALAEAVKEFLLALAAQEEADDWADNLDGSADEDADNEAERDAVVATRRVQAAERRLKVARENWVSGVPREETKP